MAKLTGLASIVSELRVLRTNLVDELKHVDAALSVLGKLSGGSSYTTGRHTVSASARKRMSLAQKARWAKAKGHTPKPKRTISAAGKKRIAAAQRARWAKVRAAKKRVA
jgi:nucleoid-associated protein YgaU